MSAPVDITGRRFERLVALSLHPTAPVRLWVCKCDCGNEAFVSYAALDKGHKRSCGCLKIEKLRLVRLSHGQYKTSEYRAWSSMKRRCVDVDHVSSHRYVGRGISVCERWRLSFENFFADMGPKPGPKYTLDRINNDGIYEPGNCRWATWTMQQRNKGKRADNKSGKTGIYWSNVRMRWVAEIRINRKTVYLGSFKTIEKAEAARRSGEIKYEFPAQTKASLS